ncbi:glycosyltransferase family A protein [Halomonas alkalicola]|uniref:glycosyltransferase family A protein n=1 Tax=Halomonas alkalicola TaxID=1930622 RepID=UPI00265F11FA|nr:glycosyltransferase family A protein [Halomonas alkalicola]
MMAVSRPGHRHGRGALRHLLAVWPSRSERRQLALIRQHGMFQPGYYRAQLPRWRRPLVWRPALHFLRHGWRQGHAPDPRFAPRWYLQRHADVRETGINPLVHFLRHGIHEGRRPAPGAVLSDLPFLRGTALWYHQQLWHGHAGRALPRLEALARKGDGAARWYLAAWHYGQGRYGQALAHLAHEAALAASSFAPWVAQARVKCHLRLGQDDALGAEPRANSLGEDALCHALVEASRVDRPGEQRLALLNRVYERHRLAPLRQRTQAPLTFSNLATRRVTARPRREMPLVSVVVPAFEAEATLEVALDGLLAQSWPHLEIIVVDDGSRDGTAELVTRRAEGEPRLRLLRHGANQGAYAARNTGMRAAQGRYVTVHDSDDWSHPQKIEQQVVALLNRPEARGALTCWVRTDPELRIVGPWHLCGDWLEENPSSLMVPREVLEELGLWDPVRVAADNEFIHRLRRHYGESALLRVCPDVPLAFSLVQPDALTQRPATHVRTVNHGLRHLYHQAARWWHGRQVVPVLDAEHPRRPFPAPLGNLRASPAAFDVAILADLSARNAELQRVIECVLHHRQAGRSVVLCPWSRPDDFASRRVADEVWELCHEEALGLAHGGLSLSAGQLLVHRLEEPGNWPDSVPRFELTRAPCWLDQRPLPEGLATPLAGYLARGGRALPATEEDHA